MLLWISIGASLVMAAALFRLFFKDLPDFIECLRFYFQPNIISLFRGEWEQDWWASLKLGVWATIAVAMGVATHYKLPQIFPTLASSGQPQTVYAAEPVPRTEPEEIIKPTVTTTETNTSATNTSAGTPAVPDYAAHYGVKVGDTVELIAIKRTIALRRATITAMDKEQIIVSSGVDTFTFRWSDINRLKPSGTPSPPKRVDATRSR
jgi:hypothetical protein